MSKKTLALFACLTPFAVNAIPITFTGTASFADDALGIAIGDAFEATVDFDLTSPSTSNIVNSAFYEIGGTVFASAGAFTSSGSITHIVIGNDFAAERYDSWAALGTLGADLPLILHLKDPDGTALDSTALFLPTSTSGYEEALWRIGAAHGTLESVSRVVSVPEPATMLLLASGLLGCGIVRRRHQRGTPPST